MELKPSPRNAKQLRMKKSQPVKRANESYKVPTCQFLASLKATFYKDGEKTNEQDGDGLIEFKLGCTNYVMTFHELSEVFGFKEEGTRRGTLFFYPRHELSFLWSAIRNKKYKPGDMKGANIRHPGIRYVHKALAHTFFGKKETSYVTKYDMEMLGLALKPLIGPVWNDKPMDSEQLNPPIVESCRLHSHYA